MTDAGVIHGKQFEWLVIAGLRANVLFRPMVVKFEGEDGEIHTIKNIQAIVSETKNYSGIPLIDFFGKNDILKHTIFNNCVQLRIMVLRFLMVVSIKYMNENKCIMDGKNAMDCKSLY